MLNFFVRPKQGGEEFFRCFQEIVFQHVKFNCKHFSEYNVVIDHGFSAPAIPKKHLSNKFVKFFRKIEIYIFWKENENESPIYLVVALPLISSV